MTSRNLQYGTAASKLWRVNNAVLVQTPAGRDPGELMPQMKSKGNLLENSLLLGEVGLFVLLRPLTD